MYARTSFGPENDPNYVNFFTRMISTFKLQVPPPGLLQAVNHKPQGPTPYHHTKLEVLQNAWPDRPTIFIVAIAIYSLTKFPPLICRDQWFPQSNFSLEVEAEIANQDWRFLLLLILPSVKQIFKQWYCVNKKRQLFSIFRETIITLKLKLD